MTRFWIRTSAAVRLLDTDGRVVGINIARAGRVVSYALPSSLVTPAVVSMLDEAPPRTLVAVPLGDLARLLTEPVG